MLVSADRKSTTIVALPSTPCPRAQVSNLHAQGSTSHVRCDDGDLPSDVCNVTGPCRHMSDDWPAQAVAHGKRPRKSSPHPTWGIAPIESELRAI